MPHDILMGSDIPTLLASARALHGNDVRIVSIRGARTGGHELVIQSTDDPAGGPRLEGIRPAPGAPARDTRRGPLVIALVGPTGSGKTTTIAKLASHPDVFKNDSVALLCLDTHRIGAIEQARAYAQLARLPLEVACDTADVRRARDKFKNRDVLLVDTAGRAPSRPGDLRETAELLAEVGPHEVHLAVPAGLEPRRVRAVFAQHRALGVTHVLATKVDEFPEDRIVRQLAAERDLPLRWMTTGLEVPADLAGAGAPLPGRAQPGLARTA